MIAVTGPAERLVMRGLAELEPLLRRLGGAGLVIGGLMTQLWLHARPVDAPVRAWVLREQELWVKLLAGSLRHVGALLWSWVASQVGAATHFFHPLRGGCRPIAIRPARHR